MGFGCSWEMDWGFRRRGFLLLLFLAVWIYQVGYVEIGELARFSVGCRNVLDNA